MKTKRYLTVIIILLVLFVVFIIPRGGWIIFYESGFKGKVIDAETKEPIEGAVVAAIYPVAIFAIVDSVGATADVLETLTYSNGEYNIPGNFFFHWPLSIGGQGTRFIVFKPGYGAYPGINTFLIYPVKPNLRDLASRMLGISTKDMEGIVFTKRMTDEDEIRAYLKKFGGGYSPFIPLKNPFEKVRNLDLPFDVDIMNLEPIWSSLPTREPFKTYPVIGLPKVKTLEERKKSRSRADRIPDGFKNKVPIWKKMLDDEYDYLFKRKR